MIQELKLGIVMCEDAVIVQALRDQLGGIALFGKGETIKAMEVQRNVHPPMLRIHTSEGRDRLQMRFAEMAQRLHFPPMHEIIDMWFDSPRRLLYFKVTGQQMVRVGMNQVIPFFELVTEKVDARPGVPEHVKGSFHRAS